MRTFLCTAALLLLAPFAAEAGTGNCGQRSIAPTGSSYSAATSDDGTLISAFNASGASLGVALPVLSSGQNGWQMCGASENNKALVFSAALLAAPGAPSLSQTTGGSLVATTYFVKLTYVNIAGETVGSAEGSLAVSANNLLVVATPGASGNATGYNVYVATSTGAETKQNAAPLSLASNWTEPSGGLISGSAPPATGTAPAAYIETGGQQLAVLTVGPDNFGILSIQWDALSGNFRALYGDLDTLLANGAAYGYPSRWVYPGGPGYASSQADNGNVISSGGASGTLTVTLPSTTKISAKFNISLSADINPIIVNVNGTSGGQIVAVGGSQTSSISLPVGSLMTLRFDGSNFHLGDGIATVAAGVPRVVTSGTTTLVRGDCGGEVVAQTGAFNQVTTSGSFPDGCQIRITNNDPLPTPGSNATPTGAKFVNFVTCFHFNALSGTYVYPQQSMIVKYRASAAAFSPIECPGLWQIPGGSTGFLFNFDPVNGSDTFGASDGLGTGAQAFKSFNEAWTFAAQNFSSFINQLVFTCTVSGGTCSGHSDTVLVHMAPHDAAPLGSAGRAGVFLNGNGVTFTQVFSIFFPAMIIETNNVTFAQGIALSEGAEWISVGGDSVCSSGTGSAIGIGFKAMVWADNNISVCVGAISATFRAIVSNSAGEMFLNGFTFSINAPVTLSGSQSAAIVATQKSYTDAGSTAWTIQSGASLTGQRYLLSSAAVLDNSTSIPVSGMTAGVGCGSCVVDSKLTLARSSVAANNYSPTSSSTYVMAGLAGSITPQGTGNIQFQGTTAGSPSTGSGTCQWQLAYGTGSAPGNGVALPAGGVLIGEPSINGNTGATQTALAAAVNSLNPTTPYWYDFAFKATGGVTCQNAGDATITAVEGN